MPKNRGKDDWQVGSSVVPFRVQNLFCVEGLTCVVTGGGSGIGSMIAAGLVANGARVYISSRKDLSALAKHLNQRGPGECICFGRLDVSKEESIETFARLLRAAEPHGIDVLVNNAGTNWSEPIEEHSAKGWDKVYDVNTRGVFLTTKHLLPLMSSEKRRRRARIINIGSIDGIQIPMLNTFAYSSGKAAVAHLTRVMAGKFGSEGRDVNVNCIAPGPFVSRMMRQTISAVGGDRVLGQTTATGRIGDPLYMAGAVLFLSSRAGEFVNGAILTLDGGLVVMPKGAIHPSPQSLSKL